MRFIIYLFLIVLAVIIGVFALAIAFGGPGEPEPLDSINDPFQSVDFSNMPPLETFEGKDGLALSYRRYPAIASSSNGSVTLVHGSSASSESMHVLAKGFAEAGFDAYALDIRGHGRSGIKGEIDHIGQLEEDMVAFVETVSPAKPATLAGFSSGGGFVLRFAGSDQQTLFDDYLLLSPYLGPQAENYREDAGGWVKVGIPRIIALGILNRFGMKALNNLPVTRFALSQEAQSFLTPKYSFALADNFAPQFDHKANIRAVNQPVLVVAGDADEAFFTDKLAGIFSEQGKDWPVKLLPGISHIPLTLDPAAVAAIVDTLKAKRAN